MGLGDVELSIWLYATKPSLMWTHNWINVTVPMIINGSLTNVTFAIHIDCVYSSGWTYIAFIPINGGFAKAYINLTLVPFLRVMASVLPRACPGQWYSPGRVYGLWLDDVEVGSRFGNQQWAANPGWGAVTWRIYKVGITMPKVINITSIISTTTITTMVTSTVVPTTTGTITSTLITTITAVTTIIITKLTVNKIMVAAIVILAIIVLVVIAMLRRRQIHGF